MSDQDQADVFLRHRSAVLDTLLSDPELSVRSVVAPPSAAGSTRVDRPAPDSVPGEQDSSVSMAAPARSPAGAKAAGGAKASDRIMALLNGQSADTAGGLEFTSDYADRAGARLGTAETSDRAPEPPPAAEPKPDRTGGEGAANVGQIVLTNIRKPKVAIGLAAALVVVIVLALVTTSGGNSERDTTRVVTAAASAPSSAAAAPQSSAQPPAAGSTIEVKSATSHCPAGSTPGMDAFSGQADKAWSCVRAYKVDGQVLTIDLGKKYQIDSIGIVPGWDSVGTDGGDLWTKYRTASRVRYQFNNPDATTYTQQTLDQRSLVVTKISPPVTASKITLSVLESKGDSSINTTAISSIVVTGQ